MEPWSTSAQTGAHEHDCPFKTTCWNLLLKKLSVSFKKLPVVMLMFKWAHHATLYQMLLEDLRKYSWHLLLDYNQKIYKFHVVLKEIDLHKNQ